MLLNVYMLSIAIQLYKLAQPKFFRTSHISYNTEWVHIKKSLNGFCKTKQTLRRQRQIIVIGARYISLENKNATKTYGF